MSQTFAVAAIQHACSDNPQENLESSMEGIEKAADEGAKLAVLPELHRTPYFCQTQDAALFDLAETVPGETTDQLGELARDMDIVVVASVFENAGSGVYHNTAVVLDADGEIAGAYRKMHVPQDPGFEEKYFFTPGQNAFQPIHTSVGSLGVMVCWDQWFPEAARLMAMAGAELLIYPTAIGWDVTDPDDEQSRQFDAWQTVQRGHAVANHLPLVACNRTGFESSPDAMDPGIAFWGGSFICGPQGEILAEGDDRESVLVAELDLSRTEKLRRNWPFFRDRRVDAYDDLLKSSRTHAE